MSDVIDLGTNCDDCITEDFCLIVVTEVNDDETEIDDDERYCRKGGAEPVNEWAVIDGSWLFAAGVTSGIDGALHLASILRGKKVPEQIQLYMQYCASSKSLGRLSI